MKLVSNVIAIAIFMSGAAFAGQPALDTLMAAAGSSFNSPAIPVVPGAARVSVKGLTSDVTDLGAADTASLVSEARAKGYAVYELDGTKMRTKPALMAHTAKVLALPADMDNWDAFIDYMGDMPQIHCNDNILIVVRNSSAIRQADPKLYFDLRDSASFSSQRVRDTNTYAVNIKFVFVP